MGSASKALELRAESGFINVAYNMLEIAIYSRGEYSERVVARDSVDIGSCAGAASSEHAIGIDDPYLAPRHFEITLCRSSEGNSAPLQCRIRNHAEPIWLVWQNETIRKGATCQVSLPVQIARGGATVEVRDGRKTGQCGGPLSTLPRPRQHSGRPSVPADLLEQSSAGTLAQWFESLCALQRSASGTQAFYSDAARAVCDPGGLDAGFVVSTIDDNWVVNAYHLPKPRLGIGIQRDIVERVRRTKRTFYHDAANVSQEMSESVIASPVFDRGVEVVGVVYAIRSMRRQNQLRGVRPLEALWVQLIAEALSGAVTRIDLETNVVRDRVLFEQAFAPQVVQELLRDPAALETRERELTLLFADLRKFTEISEHLEPRETFGLLAEVMNGFTEQVMQPGGVIIDYYGDGLAAMWNAPADQPDHPLMACHAAFALSEQLAVVNENWAQVLATPLRMGIGIHSGQAIVGNAGSDRQLKYGPRGSAVNLTSRVESATKRLGVTIAMTKAVRERVDQHMVVRRLCRARLAGVTDAIDIFELVSTRQANLEGSMTDRLWRYEEALRSFERGDLQTAEQILAAISADKYGKVDLPTQWLSAAVQSEADHGGIIDLAT